MTGTVVHMRRPSTATLSLGDEALAVAACTGDPVALAAFFDRHQAAVTRYIARITRNGADVDDLVQATFLVVAEGKARFDGRSKASTWLLGIATNVVRHHRRSMSRSTKFSERYKQVQRTEDAHAQPERTVMARSVLQRVEHALAEMTDGNRIAFILCEVEGLSAREASTVLSISETAVWKRVSDARRTLKRAAEENDGL